MILSGNIEAKNYYLKQYQETSLKVQTYLGEAKVFQNPYTTEKVLGFHHRFTSQDRLRNKVETIQHSILTQSNYSLKILDHEIKVDSHWSKCIYHLFIFYEYYEDQLSEKMKLQVPLSEEELLEILYGGLHCLKELQNNKQYHGDLRPECLVRMKDGSYRLMRQYYVMEYPERIQRQRLLDNDELYVCPNMYQVLKNVKLNDTIYRPYESDVFSLGLIILQAGIDQGVQDIFLDQKIDENNLRFLLEKFIKNFQFSEILKRCVKKMLEIDDEMRPTARGLLTALPQYRQVKEIMYRRRIKVQHQPQYIRNSYRLQRRYIPEYSKVQKVSYSPSPSTRWVNTPFPIRQSRYSCNRMN